jgi:hypothetical protein
VSLKSWSAKRDGNEKPIVAALRKAGASVIRLSEPGAPDLLVLFRGKLSLLEIKMPRKGLNSLQEAFSREGWPVCIARTEIEALRAIGALR